MIVEKKYVIVSGATGFIGKHMLKALQNIGLSVVAITRNIKNIHEGVFDNVIWCDWDNVANVIADLSVDSAMIGVIHLATEYGRDDTFSMDIEDGNVIKPLRLLELAIKNQAEVFINTDSFFAKSSFKYQHMRPYILTKTHFNALGCFYANKHDVKFVNMRLEHVYGPGDSESKFIPYIVNKLIKGELEIKCTDGSQKRDFVYVDDVVDAYIAILMHRSELPRYIECQVGTGQSVTLKTFLIYLREAIPDVLGTFKFGEIEQRVNEIRCSYADNRSLKAIGWMPKFDYKKGICELIKKM